jgi:hypothetical protein
MTVLLKRKKCAQIAISSSSAAHGMRCFDPTRQTQSHIMQLLPPHEAGNNHNLVFTVCMFAASKAPW